MARAERAGITLAALILATVVHAEGLQFGVDAGVGESDNVTLSSGNKVSQTLAVADLDFSLKQTGGRLTEDAVGNFSYLDFLQHAYSSELLGRFGGVANYALIPERLSWTLQDDWGQAQTDPFSALIPTNQVNINSLTTGPTWYARLGPTTFLNLSGLYSRADYQRIPIDNSRFQGSLQLGHEISAQSSLSANAQLERVFYRNTILNTDYNLERFYLRYELQGSRTDIALDAGVDRDVTGGTPNSGVLVKFDVKRRVSKAVTLDLAAGRTLTDSSASFNTQQSANMTATSGPTVPVNVVTNSAGILSASVYTGNYVEASWRYQRSRTGVSLTGRVE